MHERRPLNDAFVELESVVDSKVSPEVSERVLLKTGISLDVFRNVTFCSIDLQREVYGPIRRELNNVGSWSDNS